MNDKIKNKNRRKYLLTGLVIMLLAGTVYTWTIIAKSIAATYPSWSAQTLSMTFTVCMMGYALGGLTSGMLLKRVGPRPVLAAAAVLFPGGMLIASCADTPGMLYLGFGAMCGFAAGLCYNSVVSTVSKWFSDRQGVASGILLSGFGLSSFFAGKLFAAFAPADGSRAWAFGLRILALLLFAALAAGVLIMRFPDAEAAVSGNPQNDPKKEKQRSATGTTDMETGKHDSPGRRKRREPACDIPTGEMIRLTSFWLFYAWAALLTACGLLLVSQAGGIAGEAARIAADAGDAAGTGAVAGNTAGTISAGTIATAVGMISILNAVGRIVTGTFYDRFGYRKTMLLVMSSFGLSAVLMLFAVRAGSFPLVVLGFIAGGFAYGGVASISPPLIADFYGETWYASNFALIPTNALFTSFSSVLAGRIYDRTHSFKGALLLLLGAIALSFAISLLIKRPAPGDGQRNG